MIDGDIAAGGLVPVDWRRQALGPHVEIRSGESPSLFSFQGSGIPYFKVEQLNNDSKYLASTPYYFSAGKTVPRGSVIFPKRGASIMTNKVRILANDSFMDTNLMTLTPGPDLDAEFLYYSLSQLGLWRVADTTSIPQINNKHIRPLVLPLPPLPEQKAIAAALSDVDALLGALDRLIAKKRDLKQAAMQQLLTGQTRLPGFSGKWTEGHLGDVIGSLQAGVSVNSVEDDGDAAHEGMSILKTSAVSGGRFIPSECKKISPRELSRARLNPQGNTLLISRMNTPDLVGECGYVDRDYPNLFLPDRLWMSRFRQGSDASALWLAYVLSTPKLKRQIGAAATGTSGSMKNLSKQAFLQIPMAFPPGPEQEAISSVLADMDAELTGLEQRRDKTRLLKQGMMQELLTGRTRLV